MREVKEQRQGNCRKGSKEVKEDEDGTDIFLFASENRTSSSVISVKAMSVECRGQKTDWREPELDGSNPSGRVNYKK